MIKRILCVLMSAVVLMIVSACGESKNNDIDQTNSIVIVTDAAIPASTPSSREETSAAKETIAEDETVAAVNPMENAQWYNTLFLKSDIKATVVDEDITNTVPNEGAGTQIILPLGTVLFPENISQDSYLFSFSEDMDFYTVLGSRVHISAQKSESGDIVFEGRSVADLFGGYVENTDEDYCEGDEYVVTPWKQADRNSHYVKYVVQIDWNQDGIEDEFLQKYSTLTYTDGKTGKITDLTNKVRIEASSQAVYFFLDSTILLCQNSEGEYGMLLSYDLCSSDYSTFAVTYDPDTIIAYKNIEVPTFRYEDGQLYAHPYTDVLGNQWSLNQTVDLADDFTFTNFSDTKMYNKSPYCVVTIYTIAKIDIEMTDSSGFTKEILPVGIAVFPEKLMNEDSTQYLYVTLADGREGRFELTEENYPILINGIEQNLVFGGMLFGG